MIFISHFLLDYISAINTYLHSKQEKNWGNMTSYNQLKYFFFLLLFYIKIAYFVRERIELFIGIYISMKSTFLFKPESSEKMVKTSKFVSQKQNKKNWRQTIKTITNEFKHFDVRPLHCNSCFFLQEKQQDLYCAFSTNIMLKNIQ